MPPRERQLIVSLYDRRVGVIHARDDYASFAFDDDYLNDPERAVLGLLFEEDLRARHASNRRLPPWFSNLLPEGRLREWIATARGVSVEREFELLTQVGHDLPGAVTVAPANDPIEIPPRPREITASHGAPDSDVWRFSLAGVAMKFSMLAQGERFTAPAAFEGGDWIVKLPDRTHPHVPSNEHAMMELARHAGLDVPETRLVHRDQIDALPEGVWPGGEDFAYAIRRFDRTPSRARIHIEDFAQVRGFYADDKYHGTFETLAARIYRGRDLPSLLEFVRRLAFVVLIRNGDAHLKNWSLIYRDPRRPTLSPAYDLVSTALYRPRSNPEDLALRFGGSKRFEAVRLATFEALRAKLHVAGPSFADEVVNVVDRALAAWPDIASRLTATHLAAPIGDALRDGAALLTRSTSAGG